MKIITTLCWLCLVVAANAQTTIELNYKPKGVIILFNFNKLKIYTDTTTVFDAISQDYDKSKIRNLILFHIKNVRNDTITLMDSMNGKYEGNWYLDDVIFQLTDNNKVEIFDQSNKLVKSIYIKTKKRGNKYYWNVYIIYKNKRTKKELFEKVEHWHVSVPRFY